MSAARLLAMDPAGKLTFQLDWSADIPSGVTLTSVSHSVPAGFTKHSESTNTTANTSSVQFSGIQHADLHVLEAVATLSNGDLVPGSFTLRGFNG